MEHFQRGTHCCNSDRRAFASRVVKQREMRLEVPRLPRCGEPACDRGIMCRMMAVLRSISHREAAISRQPALAALPRFAEDAIHEFREAALNRSEERRVGKEWSSRVGAERGR